MSTQPCAAVKFREFDANGAPLAGGKLYSYAAGTTTPLATYTDASGAVANANPIVLDAAGRADVWLTPSLGYKFVLKDSADVTQYTVDNYPAPSASAVASTSNAVMDPGGRLTLTSGTPVTTVDVTGATTIYYVPYKSNYVPLYDGSDWTLWSIGSELSQTTTDTTKSPAAVGANSVYDLFVWEDSGTVRLSRGPAWSTGTARGSGAGTTELERVNGRLVNKVAITNGPAAQRGLYVGTVGSDASSQVSDSTAKRYVWNNYNRIIRRMQVLETTASWVYSTSTWRQARAQTTNQLDYVCGMNEDEINVVVYVAIDNAGSAGNSVAIGVDSTTSPSGHYAKTISTNDNVVSAFYLGPTGLGRHYLAWLEWGQFIAADATWYGNTNAQSGITGSILA